MTRFARFGLVAGVAFCVDISALYLFSHALGLSLLEARLLSLPMAASTAWYGNRRTTFSDRALRPMVRQWMHYLLVNCTSGLVNYSVYAILIVTSAWLAHHPPAAIAPGALCGMLINFACANLWIFPAG